MGEYYLLGCGLFGMRRQMKTYQIQTSIDIPYSSLNKYIEPLLCVEGEKVENVKIWSALKYDINLCKTLHFHIKINSIKLNRVDINNLFQYWILWYLCHLLYFLWKPLHFVFFNHGHLQVTLVVNHWNRHEIWNSLHTIISSKQLIGSFYKQI